MLCLLHTQCSHIIPIQQQTSRSAMTKSINQQMQDLHDQALVAQSEGFKRDWEAAKTELDTLYEMADDLETDIAKHPTMPQHEKDSLLRKVEHAAGEHTSHSRLSLAAMASWAVAHIDRIGRHAKYDMLRYRIARTTSLSHMCSQRSRLRAPAQPLRQGDVRRHRARLPHAIQAKKFT